VAANGAANVAHYFVAQVEEKQTAENVGVKQWTSCG
jgi:hypothetical protein